MASITLLVGQIASGKSTLCKKLASSGSIILNDDNTVTALHGGDYKLYDKKLKPLYKAMETTVITMAWALGKDVVIDRTCLDPITRQRYISLAKSMDITDIRATVFPLCSPIVHAQRRMASDSRGYDLEYWTKVAKFLEAKAVQPGLDEGFTEINYWHHGIGYGRRIDWLLDLD